MNPPTPPLSHAILWPLTLLLILATHPAHAEEDYPSVTLANDSISLDIYLPDTQKGFYRAQRFDHAGIVAQATFKRHTFFGELVKPHDPTVHDHAAGTPEEFSMFAPPGFDQAKPGQPFLKIGVGALAKPQGAEPYGFFKDYKVLDQPKWQIEKSPDAITFQQTVTAGNLAYEYTKTVRLTPDGFKLVHQLKNTGKSPLTTDHYGHNYLIFDNQPITAANYQLLLPFEPKIVEGASPLRAQVDKNTVTLPKDPQNQASWTRFEGFSKNPGDNLMKITNTDTHTSLTIQTDLPMTRLVLYATKSAFCPEAFIELNLKPTQSQQWTTTYTFQSP